MADIKNMLDDIIDRTNKSYPASAENVKDGNLGALHKINAPTTFDKGAFKEKLAMYVLKDVIQAMMVDDTSDLDNTIDTSILRHMNDDCGCGCYNYLKNAKERLKSDLIGDIIQEIDAKTDEVAKKVSDTKDPSVANDVDVKDLLKNVDDYEEFTKLLTEKTTNQVVDQMKKVIVGSNRGPVWNDKDVEEGIGNGAKKPTAENNAVKESSIMKIYSTIIYESYVDGKPTIDEETGMEMAFIEYCLDQLDHAFKATPRRPIMARYNR
jgi:hypothetical protein